MRKKSTVKLVCVLCILIFVFSSCVGGRGDGAYYAANRTYADYDLAAALGVSFENTLIDLTEPEPGEAPAAPVEDESYPNESDALTEFTMRVYGKMEIFAKVGDTVSFTLLGKKVTKTVAAIYLPSTLAIMEKGIVAVSLSDNMTRPAA